MRIDDVQIGEHYTRQYGGRVRVDGTTTTLSAPAWGQPRKMRQLIVTPVDFDTGEPPEGQGQIVMPARDLSRPWAEYAAAVEATRKARTEIDELTERLNVVLPEGIEAHGVGARSITIRLSPDKARKLAEVLDRG